MLLPLPDSTLLAGNWGASRLFSMGVLFRAVSFRAFHRLPAVTVRTPTAQKVDNRSIACLLRNFTMCICRSKPGLSRSLLSHPRSMTYAHPHVVKSLALIPKLGLFTTLGRFLTDSEGSGNYPNLFGGLVQFL